MRSPEQIVVLYRDRSRAEGARLSRMREVRDQYNGDIVVPLSGVTASDRPAVQNMVKLGVNQYAQRAASVLPEIVVDTLGPGMQARKSARRRRAGFNAMWEANSMRRLLARRTRHYFGYGGSPVMLRPDFVTGGPRWEVRDPLGAFPSLSVDQDAMKPADCVFMTRMRAGDALRTWPDGARIWSDDVDRDASTMVEIVEYVDAEQRTLIGFPSESIKYLEHLDVHHVLEHVPNRAGVCPVVYPAMVTMDRTAGQFDGVLGIYTAMAKVDALSLIALKKAVLQEEWLVGSPGETPNIIQIPEPDQGLPGIVEGGQLENRSVDPQWAAYAGLDRIERAARIEGGIPSDLTGEAGTNVRTGRRAAQLQSAVIDFPIQECQMLFAESMQRENEIAVEIDKAYFGDVKKSFTTTWKGQADKTDFTPDSLWVSSQNACVYPLAGADANGLVIAVGQRVGMGTMSKREAMRIDPLVRDEEKMHDEIIAEGIEAALMQQMQTLASNPDGPFQPVDLARVMELVVSDEMELAAAITTVHKEIQERQATEVEQADPAAQPGLAPPGQGTEAPVAIGGPSKSQENLSSLLFKMRGAQMQTPAETR